MTNYNSLEMIMRSETKLPIKRRNSNDLKGAHHALIQNLGQLTLITCRPRLNLDCSTIDDAADDINVSIIPNYIYKNA